jgi:hypothetical protein
MNREANAFFCNTYVCANVHDTSFARSLSHFLLDMRSRFASAFPFTTRPSGAIQSIRTCISKSIKKYGRE